MFGAGAKIWFQHYLSKKVIVPSKTVPSCRAHSVRQKRQHCKICLFNNFVIKSKHRNDICHFL